MKLGTVTPPAILPYSDSSYPVFCLFVFFDRVFLYSPGYPQTLYVVQTGLELSDLPASAFQVLALKACTTMSSSYPEFLCFHTKLGIVLSRSVKDGWTFDGESIESVDDFQ